MADVFSHFFFSDPSGILITSCHCAGGCNTLNIFESFESWDEVWTGISWESGTGDECCCQAGPVTWPVTWTFRREMKRYSTGMEINMVLSDLIGGYLADV